MAKIDKLIVTTDTQPRTWTVVEVPGAYEISIGWVHDDLDADEAPPKQVEELLSDVLAATGSVVYGRPEGEGTSAQRVALITGYEFNGFFGMFGSKIEFIWTDKADVIKQMFDTNYMIWCHEGQFALIFKTKTQPTVARNGLLGALKHQEFGAASLKSSGVIGALVPGADGDFAQAIFYNTADRDAFLHLLEETCKAKNMTWEKVSGQQFEEFNWYVTAAPTA
ncbi:MAG TPA: hypothetical protein V6C81_05490 [Planktothrix sp.]|jgi:hypothetical protein